MLSEQVIKDYIWGLYKVSWDKIIKPKINQIILITILAAADRIEHRDNSYEVYGFDILIDNKLNPW